MKTISRKALYDRVWDTPMSRLAKEYGLSDRGLAKLCTRHDIPVPPRGYWAKKQAGHNVRQVALPDDKGAAEMIIHLPSSAQRSDELEELITHQQKNREAEKPDEQAIEIPVQSPHKSIEVIARKLRKQKAEFVSAGQLRSDNVHSISVSEAQTERLIAILDRIIRLGEARGLLFEFPSEGAKVHYEGRTISIGAGELHRTVPHELTDKERKALEKWQASREKRSARRSGWDDMFSRPRFPEQDQVYSGRLFFKIDSYEPSLRKSWQDGKIQRLDNLCSAIIDTLEAHFLANRVRAEQAEKERREREILQHRRQLSEQRKKRETDRASLLSNTLDLITEADRLRQFLSQFSDADATEPELRRFLKWAKARLEQIDHDLSPPDLAANLRDLELFPEPDPLHDSLGEPPPKTSWWM